MKLEHYLTPNTKINSKWIKVPNVRLVPSKLLTESIGRRHFDINHGSIFLIFLLKEIKTKMKKWDLIKLKSFAQKGSNKQN